MVIELSVGYETWPPLGWNHPFVIGWSKDRLGLPSAPLHYGPMWPVGIPIVFQTPVTVPLHSLTAGKCLLLGLSRGTVKESTYPMFEVITVRYKDKGTSSMISQWHSITRPSIWRMHLAMGVMIGNVFPCDFVLMKAWPVVPTCAFLMLEAAVSCGHRNEGLWPQGHNNSWVRMSAR